MGWEEEGEGCRPAGITITFTVDSWLSFMGPSPLAPIPGAQSHPSRSLDPWLLPIPGAYAMQLAQAQRQPIPAKALPLPFNGTWAWRGAARR